MRKEEKTEYSGLDVSVCDKIVTILKTLSQTFECINYVQRKNFMINNFC